MRLPKQGNVDSMKYLLLLVLLVGCGSGGGSDPEPLANIPAVNPGDSNCSGDVSFNTVVPDAPVDVPAVDVPVVDDAGIINPAVSKVVEAADYQGLKIIRMERREVEKVTIIVTCSSGVSVSEGNTVNNPAPLS